MGLFDILTNGSIPSILSDLASQTKSVSSQVSRNMPGGLGGLMGAGALGALLGNVVTNDVIKNVALAGAGAVAWNFFQKWRENAQQGGQETGQPKAALASASSHAFGGVDPTAELIMRAMTYAAKADGNIDATERQRIDTILKNMLPGENVNVILEKISKEPLNPEKIAASVSSPAQGEDVYRLSCAVIDIDHFMERGYLDALAKALGISQSQAASIEKEAEMAKKQLMAAVKAGARA